MADSTLDNMAAITTPAESDVIYVSAAAGDRKLTIANLRTTLGGVLAIATTGNVRTQASYSAAAQGVTAMTSDLDLTITAPTGTTKVKLDWSVMGEDDATGLHCFVVYKSISGGAYNLLTMSRDGSANYWSVIAKPVADGDFNSTPSTTFVSVIDTSPSVGSSVTYRLYVTNIRDASAGSFYLNRCVGSAGAAFYAAGSSTGEAKCI